MSTSVPAERIAALLGYADFAAVIDLVERSAVIDAFEWEPFNDVRLRGCHRASFLLRVSTTAYDAFFNSPVGYRGQFGRGEGEGERANRELIDRLKPRLLDKGTGGAAVLADRWLVSLNGTDAKVWIFEREVQNHLGDDTPEIFHEPWRKASSDGVGLRAPLGTLLEVKGAWLDAQGRERRDPYKSTRSQDIHSVGFS